jgi:hypothetical protein
MKMLDKTVSYKATAINGLTSNGRCVSLDGHRPKSSEPRGDISITGSLGECSTSPTHAIIIRHTHIYHKRFIVKIM